MSEIFTRLCGKVGKTFNNLAAIGVGGSSCLGYSMWKRSLPLPFTSSDKLGIHGPPAEGPLSPG